MQNNVNGPIFAGGKITNYSKQFNPNLMIPIPLDLDLGYLQFSKMLPKINNHYSGVTENYIYIYLNPFKPAKTIDDFHYKVPPGIFGIKDLYFGYEPIYVGKGISSTGHRLNQHVADFLNLDEDIVGNTKVKNVQKMEKLKEISSHFGKAFPESQVILPTNWPEYKKEWIQIYITFPDRLSLEVGEKILINTIGSLSGLRRGPLTNISLTKV